MKSRHSRMYALRNALVDVVVTSPLSEIRCGVKWIWVSTAFIIGEWQELRMLLRCCCPTAVPMAPIEAPIIADGFRVKAFSPYGRLAQSMAFFNPPGMERLYSGVTKSTASTWAIAALKSLATGG